MCVTFSICVFRGLVLTKILSALEEQSWRSVLQLFDWLGGTSTGGILTLALALGKSTRECQAELPILTIKKKNLTYGCPKSRRKKLRIFS